MTTPLTAKQTLVLDFMRAFLAENDSMPSSPTIAGYFGFGSPNAAHEHIAALVRKGYLERNAQNGWRFTRSTEKEPAC